MISRSTSALRQPCRRLLEIAPPAIRRVGRQSANSAPPKAHEKSERVGAR
jgi:hypothetical protein